VKPLHRIAWASRDSAAGWRDSSQCLFDRGFKP
jgi:hypothetical protein